MKSKEAVNKRLKFSSELVPLVLSGEKDTTWRLWDDKNLSGGDTVDFIDIETKRCFATAKLTKVNARLMGGLTKEDRVGHEPFDSDKQMYDTYSRYYGRSVGPDTPVKIIRFELEEKIK